MKTRWRNGRRRSDDRARGDVRERTAEARDGCPQAVSPETEVDMDTKGGSMMKATQNHTLSTGLSNLATLLPATNELLHRVGLQRRRSRARRTARAAGLFGAGALVGTGIAMLLTPKSGRQVRREIGERARSVKEYVRPEDSSRRQARS
ncbi:MAG: YtxH domain-containing protein [Myxococcota bacterium]